MEQIIELADENSPDTPPPSSLLHSPPSSSSSTNPATTSTTSSLATSSTNNSTTSPLQPSSSPATQTTQGTQHATTAAPNNPNTNITTTSTPTPPSSSSSSLTNTTTPTTQKTTKMADTNIVNKENNIQFQTGKSDGNFNTTTMVPTLNNTSTTTAKATTTTTTATTAAKPPPPTTTTTTALPDANNPSLLTGLSQNKGMDFTGTRDDANSSGDLRDGLTNKTTTMTSPPSSAATTAAAAAMTAPKSTTTFPSSSPSSSFSSPSPSSSLLSQSSTPTSSLLSSPPRMAVNKRLPHLHKLEKKHSSGDLHSRLKTRKILGVGETDDGGVHRSKISQILGHNDQLYVRLPYGLRAWQFTLALLYAGLGLWAMVHPGHLFNVALQTDASHDFINLSVRLYGGALISLSILHWATLNSQDRDGIRVTLLSSIVFFIVQFIVSTLSSASQGSPFQWLIGPYLDGGARLFLLAGSAYFYQLLTRDSRHYR